MSMELMVAAMKTKVGNPMRKLVLIKLADNANDHGECWPSYQHIADQCEIGRSTVRKHIKDLEDMGLLSIENRKGPKGNSSNVYHLTLQGRPPKSIPVSPDSTPVSRHSTPPVPPDSTGISHSFEPVNEPVIEPKNDDAREYVTSPDDPLFDVGQPKPVRFKIELDWRPDQAVLIRYCNNAGCQIVNRPDWLMNDIIGEWVNYWHAEGSMQSESKWYAKLSAWIKRKLADHDSQPAKRTRKSGEPCKTDYRSDTCGMELAN